jgi:hypothetical protein
LKMQWKNACSWWKKKVLGTAESRDI